MKDIIGARVRELREKLDLSQTQLAALICEQGFGPLSYQAIQQLEDGTVKKPRYAMYLAKVLRTSWEYLIGDTDNPVGVVSGSLGNNMRDSGTAQNEVRTQEGPKVLADISHMLGLMEGRMEARSEARFTHIKDKLEDHEKRLEALEGRPHTGPRKGTRGR